MLLMIILPVNHCLGQEVTDQALLKDQYLLKAKRQKTAAWVTLTTGITMLVGGLVVFSNSWEDNFWSTSNTTTDVAGFVAISGFFISLASVPIFVTASSNNKKAASLSVGYQHIYNAGPDMMLSKTAMPSLVLRIEF